MLLLKSNLMILLIQIGCMNLLTIKYFAIKLLWNNFQSSCFNVRHLMKTKLASMNLLLWRAAHCQTNIQIMLPSKMLKSSPKRMNRTILKKLKIMKYIHLHYLLIKVSFIGFKYADHTIYLNIISDFSSFLAIRVN